MPLLPIPTRREKSDCPGCEVGLRNRGLWRNSEPAAPGAHMGRVPRLVLPGFLLRPFSVFEYLFHPDNRQERPALGYKLTAFHRIGQPEAYLWKRQNNSDCQDIHDDEPPDAAKDVFHGDSISHDAF